MSKERIFVCADIHGSAQVIKNIIKNIDNPTEKDTIIIAGDAGFEYGKYIMGNAKKAANNFLGKWIVLRGNHDNCYESNHSYYSEVEDKYVTREDGWHFHEDEFQNFYLVQNKYPNIWYLPDNGCIYTISDYTFLFAPGAYSVDKYYRLRNGYPYNDEEQLSLKRMHEFLNIVIDWNSHGFPIDYVIGHTFPQKMEKYYKDLFINGLDQSKIDKRTERWLDSMARIFEKNNAFKQYYGGHFHDERQLTDKYTMVYQNPIEIGN